MYYQGKLKQVYPNFPEAKGLAGSFQINEKNERPIKIISIGESTIAGVGVETHEEGSRELLPKRFRNCLILTLIEVYARSGYTAKRVEYKLISKISECRADLIIVGLGGNDAFTLNRPTKWKNEIDSLIKSIKNKISWYCYYFLQHAPIKNFQLSSISNLLLVI